MMILVSRFRSSHHCAAHSFANFGIKGTLAIYDSSAVFGFEVPTQTRGYNDRNFKSTALARAIRKCGTIVQMIWRRPQAAAIAIRPANVMMIGLSLGALLTTSNFVQTAKAQQSNTAREQALRECSLLERRDTHEPHEGTKTGGRQFVYKACMADHGQVE